MVFATRKRSVVPVSLLQSYSSLCCVIKRNEIYTLVCRKTFFLGAARTFLPQYQNRSVVLLGLTCLVFGRLAASHVEYSRLGNKHLHNCYLGRH
jgi:hypothetical protein